jgi:hypothetical protein
VNAGKQNVLLMREMNMNMKLEYPRRSLYSISSGVRGKSSTDYFKVDDAIT